MIADFSYNSFEFNPVFLAILTLFVLSTFLVFSCIWFRKRCKDFCPDRTFKGLEENEESYFNDISISTVPRISFPLQPQVPVQNHAYEHNFSLPYNNPVTFEPIPKLTKKTIHRVDNLFGQLRPRIARIGYKLPNGTEETNKQLDIIKNLSDGTFPRSQLQYIKELGVNKFAKVLQGEAFNMQPGRKRTQVTVVMIDTSSHPTHQLTLLREALPYRQLKHTNVMRFFRICTDSEPPLTIYESLKMGDLKTYLRSHRSDMQGLLNQGIILSMICDITAGLQALHHMDYVHRDLALRNCMLTSDMVVKIGDYGLAEQLYKDDYFYNNDDDSVGIPLRWMAPESLSLSYSLYVNDVTKEANIWTIGVVMWEMLRCGDVPYPDLSNDYVIRLVAIEKQVKPQRPLVVMDNIKCIYELMDMCWAYEVANRPTIRELKILLLHLASSKSADDATFNEKWIQLKPIIPSNLNHDADDIGNALNVNSGDENADDSGVSMLKQGAFKDGGLKTGIDKDEGDNNVNINNNNNNDTDEISDSELFSANFSKFPDKATDSTNNLSLAEELKLHMRDLNSPNTQHTDTWATPAQAVNDYSNLYNSNHGSLNTSLNNNNENNNNNTNNNNIDNINKNIDNNNNNNTYATSYDASPSDVFEDNSLLKMRKYNEYLQTVTTSIDDSSYEFSTPKNSQSDSIN